MQHRFRWPRDTSRGPMPSFRSVSIAFWTTRNRESIYKDFMTSSSQSDCCAEAGYTCSYYNDFHLLVQNYIIQYSSPLGTGFPSSFMVRIWDPRVPVDCLENIHYLRPIRLSWWRSALLRRSLQRIVIDLGHVAQPGQGPLASERNVRPGLG